MSKPAAEGSSGGGGNNVRVMVRVRPFNKREMEISQKQGQEHPDCVIHMRDNTCVVMEHFRDDKGFAQSKEREAFQFDECFWSLPAGVGDSDKPFADQKFVYERSGLLALNAAFDGFNTCLFAYGQTGSGKTHSMLGNDADPGISPRMVDDLFARIEKESKLTTTTKFVVECMFYEVYNEKVRDLFNKETKTGNYDAPKIRQHPTKGTYVEGLIRKETKTAAETKALLEKGSKERAMSATKMNAHSSRSHAIFQIALTQNRAQTGTQRAATINLVDLAGSEKVRDSGVTGEGFQEAKNINLSLSTLRKVIDCLIDNATSKKKKVPPFRESVLTYVLSDSLGGNSRTMMMSAVSPHEVNTEDTLNTLRYALRAKAIVCNATVNEEKSAKMMDAMKDELRKLREALANGGAAAGGEGGEGGGRPMMPEEIKAEIEQREAEMNKMEKEQEALNALLQESKKREEEVQKQLTEVAEQRAALDIEVEQKKRERFAAAFRSAFMITKDKQRHADQQKQLEEEKQLREDAVEQATRAKQQLEIVRKETSEKVQTLEKELADSEEKLNAVFKENKEEREKLRNTLQQKVSSLEAEVATNKEIMEAIRQESDDEIAELKTRLRSQIVNLEKELHKTKSEGEETQTDLKNQMERQQRIANEKMSDVESRLTDAQAENQKLRADARTSRDQAREQASELHRQISALQRRLEEAADEKEVEIRTINEQNSRKLQQQNQQVSELEKKIANLKERSEKQEKENKETQERLTKTHQNELSDLRQSLEEQQRKLSQQLSEAQKEQQKLTAEIDQLTSESERNLEFERKLREDSVRDIKTNADRTKAQLSRKIAELEIELQTEKANSDQALQAAKSSAKAETESLETELQSVKEQLRSAESRCDSLRHEKEAALRQNAELQRNQAGAANEELEKKVSSLEQQLREAREGEKRAQSQLTFRTSQFESEVKELSELNEEIRRDSKKFLDSQIADLQSRISEHQQQTDAERARHREAISARDKIVSEKTSKLSESEREISSLKDQSTAIEAELKHARSTLEQSQKESQQRIDELSKELAETRESKLNEDSKILESQKNFRAQVAKVAELEQQVQTLQASLEKKEYSLNQIEDRMNQERLSEVSELKSELSKSEEARTAAESQARMMQTTISNHVRTESELNSKIEEFQQKNIKLHDQISAGQEKLVTELRQKISQHQQEAHNAKAELESVEEAHKEQLSVKEKRISELTNDLSIARQSLSLFESESARRLNLIENNGQAKLTAIESELRVLRDSLRAAEKNLRTSKSENNILQEKLNQLGKSLEMERGLRASESAAASSASTQATLAAKQQFTQQKLSLEKELDGLRKNLIEAEGEKKRKLEEQANTHRAQLFDLKQQLSVANAEREAAESKLQDAQRNADRVTDLENQLFESETAKETLVASHSAELGRVSLQLQVAESQCKQYQEQVNVLEKKLASYDGENRDADGENNSSTTDSPTKARSRNNIAPSASYENLQARITQLEASLEEAHDSNRKAQLEYSAQLEHTRNRYQDQIAKLQSEIQSVNSQREAESRNFKDKLKNLSEEHKAHLNKESAASKSALDSALAVSNSNLQAMERQMKNRVTELELENSQLSRDLAVSKAKADSLQQNVNRSNQRTTVAEDKLAILKQEHDTMTAEVATLRHARDELVQAHQTTVADMNNQIAKLEASHRIALSDAQSDLESKSKQFESKEASLQTALKNAHDNLDSARRESKATLEKVKALSEARVQELEEQLAERNSALHRAQLEHSSAIKALEDTYHSKLREVRDNAASLRSAANSMSESSGLADLEAQCRTLQLAAEQARQAKDAAERRLSLEQGRVVAMEAEVSSSAMKRELLEADFDALKSAHAKQISQLQSTVAQLEGESSALKQTIERLNREIASEREQVTEAAEQCKELGHKLHMTELKYRETSDSLGAERVSYEQRIGNLERRLQESNFEKDRADRAHLEELNRVQTQCDRRVHELEVALINATDVNDISGGDNNNNSPSPRSRNNNKLHQQEQEIERLRDEISHYQMRISELEKEATLAKASAVRAEHDFDEAYDRIKEQNNKRVADLEKELSSLRHSLHQAQRESKEALERTTNSSNNRTAELQQQLNQALNQQVVLREEAKSAVDRLERQHADTIKEWEQKLSNANAATDTTNGDLAVTQMLKGQAERRVAELESEIRRLNEEMNRIREDAQDTLEQAKEMHKLEVSDLEMQLEKQKQQGVSSTKELSAARDRLSGSMQQRITELERLLQKSNEARQTLQGELEQLRRARDQQKIQFETKISDLQSQIKMADDSSLRAQSEYKETMERLKSQHQLSLTEAEKRSPAARHLEAIKDMEAKVLATKKTYDDKERGLRATFEQELTIRYQREKHLESENQNLRVAIQQMKMNSDESRKRLVQLERENRIHGLEQIQQQQQDNTSYMQPSFDNSMNSNSNGRARNSPENINELSALDAARQRARMNSAIANNIRNLYGSGHHETSNNNNNGSGLGLEISHMFTHQQQKKRSQTPNASSSARMNNRPPFRLM